MIVNAITALCGLGLAVERALAEKWIAVVLFGAMGLSALASLWVKWQEVRGEETGGHS